MPNNYTEFFEVADEEIKHDYFQTIIHSETFYFDRLKEWFNDYLAFDVEPIRHYLDALFLQNQDLWKEFSYVKVLELAKDSGPLLDFFHLIGKMVAIFDEKGYHAAVWNPYPDRRRVSRANMRQDKWTYGFILCKLNGNFNGLDEGYYNTFKNAVKFIQSPETRLNMTSNNHRQELFKYFFPDDKEKTDEEVIQLFKPYTQQLQNQLNAGVLTNSLLYNARLKRFWKSEVLGLMAADGTDWHDDYIEEFEGFDRGIIWNSGTPSGTTTTIKALRNKLQEDGSFSLFYKRGDRVRYVAEVVDFVTNDKELKEKAWDKRHQIYSYRKNFADYADSKKSAKIVFLTTGLKKLEPTVPLNFFKFFNGYQAPTQHNLSPLEQVPEEIIKKNLINTTINAMNSAVNVILYGPPGTGKTYRTIDEAINLIDPGFKPEGATKEELRQSLKDHYRKLQDAGHICFTTFHQSYTYEDFIEGIKPLPPRPDKPVQYDVLSGIFKNLVRSAASVWEGKDQTDIPDFEKAFEALKAELEMNPNLSFETKTPGYPFTIRNITDTTIFPINSGGTTSNSLSIGTLREIYYGRRENRPDGAGVYYPGVIEKLKSYIGLTPDAESVKDFVIIIDEINRGNISQIFGELITLIEPSKRLGEPEELILTLPYSKDRFAVPPNVHIIGTMNTADRSVEALDTALRRRFSFKEMMPELDSIEELSQAITGLDFTAAELLKKLNQRIIILKDREHQIGHAYFIHVRSIADLMLVFKDKIIPLLQEYFFGDYEKLQLVLGRGFVRKTEAAQDIFATHDSESDLGYEDADFYQLRADAFASEVNFKAALADFKVK